MIKTKIQFNCTWPKEDVKKLFDKLINASGITELGLSMISIPGEVQEHSKACNNWDSEKYAHPSDDPNFAPIKSTVDSAKSKENEITIDLKHPSNHTCPTKMVSMPGEHQEEVLQGPSDMATIWDQEMFDNPVDDPNSEIVKIAGRTADSITFASGEREATIKLKPTEQAAENQKEQIEEKPKSNMFTEIEPISKDELGTLKKTQKPIITHAETQDGRVAIYYNEAPMYSTMAAIRALPDKITNDMVKSMPAGKRAALRGFKKFLTELDKSGNKPHENSDSDEDLINGVDPYAPILTGGAKVDTHARGKIGDVS